MSLNIPRWSNIVNVLNMSGMKINKQTLRSKNQNIESNLCLFSTLNLRVSFRAHAQILFEVFEVCKLRKSQLEKKTTTLLPWSILHKFG